MQHHLLLMVEDEALTALCLQDVLESAGFTVQQALKGQAALALLRDNQGMLAAVITDIRFGPGLEGWDVAERARELNADIPIIYMTGDSAHEHARRGVSQSIMLQKPFTPELLLASLRVLMPSEEMSNPAGPGQAS
jgi:DNA-binding response OmpR family regulator